MLLSSCRTTCLEWRSCLLAIRSRPRRSSPVQHQSANPLFVMSRRRKTFAERLSFCLFLLTDWANRIAMEWDLSIPMRSSSSASLIVLASLWAALVKRWKSNVVNQSSSVDTSRNSIGASWCSSRQDLFANETLRSRLWLLDLLVLPNTRSLSKLPESVRLGTFPSLRVCTRSSVLYSLPWLPRECCKSGVEIIVLRLAKRDSEGLYISTPLNFVGKVDVIGWGFSTFSRCQLTIQAIYTTTGRISISLRNEEKYCPPRQSQNNFWRCRNRGNVVSYILISQVRGKTR